MCFEQKYEKYQIFLSENFHFLVVKFSVYLNRHVFVMHIDPFQKVYHFRIGNREILFRHDFVIFRLRAYVRTRPCVCVYACTCLRVCVQAL